MFHWIPMAAVDLPVWVADECVSSRHWTSASSATCPLFLHKAIRSDVASLSKTLSSNRTEESKVRSPNSSDPVAECRCTRPSAHAARCPCQPAACHPRCSCRSWTPTAGASPAVTVPSQQRPLPTVFARSLAALAYVERARHGLRLSAPVYPRHAARTRDMSAAAVPGPLYIRKRG